MERSFGEDYQALLLSKRHRHAFVAQEVALLLLGLAHNILVRTRDWLPQDCAEVQDFDNLQLARDVIELPGLITFNATGWLVLVTFNGLAPLGPKLLAAWQSLPVPLDVVVTLAEP